MAYIAASALLVFASFIACATSAPYGPPNPLKSTRDEATERRAITVMAMTAVLLAFGSGLVL